MTPDSLPEKGKERMPERVWLIFPEHGVARLAFVKGSTEYIRADYCAGLEAENKALRDAGDPLLALVMLAHYQCLRANPDGCDCILQRALSGWSEALSTPTQEEGT